MKSCAVTLDFDIAFEGVNPGVFLLLRLHTISFKVVMGFVCRILSEAAAYRTVKLDRFGRALRRSDQNCRTSSGKCPLGWIVYTGGKSCGAKLPSSNEKNLVSDRKSDSWLVMYAVSSLSAVCSPMLFLRFCRLM